MNAGPAALQPLALSFDGIQLVEASAGTGKTWLIAALYVRLVLGHRAAGALLPPQILVVTFTKAATAELRERIRSRLTEAAAVFRGAATKDEFLRDLLAAYPTGHSRDSAALRLELAAQWMDEAAIFTIHAWCQRMLTRHAFDSGRPFAQSAEADENELLHEACRDYWRRECYPLPRRVFVPLHEALAGPGELARRVGPLLPKLDGVLEGGMRGDGRLLALLETMFDQRAGQHAALRGQWMQHLDALDAALPALSACCSGTSWRPQNYSGWLATLRAWARGDTDAPVLTDAAWNRLSRDGMTQALKNGAELPEVPVWDAIGELRAFHSSPLPIAATVIRHAVPLLRTAIADAKQRAAQIGFDDMLTQMDAALAGPSAEALATRLRDEFPLAMIDEFQDTDPGQWRIFERIYRGHGGLLLIGDPKQAIYSFRGADIHTYFAARATARSPAHTLGRNHRSTKAMVAAVNALFAHGEAACRDGAFHYGRGEEGLAFHAVAAAGRDDRLQVGGDALPALRLACDSSGELLTKEQYCATMAEACAAEIARLLQLSRQQRCRVDGGRDPRALAAGDIAVLVRSRREAGRITDALRARGLACVYLSDTESVFASAEAGDLLLWLHAMAEPGADRRLRAALATRSFGLGFGDLDRLSTDELYREHCCEIFRQCQHAWRRSGVLAAVRRLLHAFAIPPRLLAAGAGERSLTNLLHLAELLQHAAVSLDGEQALLRHFGDEITAARLGRPEGNDTRVMRLESEDALVKVVTIHKSKGLEYPLVFVPFACSFREAKLDDDVLEYRRDGRRIISLLRDPAAQQQADLDRLREDARLLYVAVTRAQFSCWIGVGAIGDGGGRSRASAVAKSAFGYLLGGGEPLSPDGLVGQLQALGRREPGIDVFVLPTVACRDGVPPVHDATRMQPARTVAAAPRPRWWISSYSALAHGAGSDPESAAEAVLAEARVDEARVVDAAVFDVADAGGTHVPIAAERPLDAFPRGAAAGSFLHTLLEWAAAVGFDRASAEPACVRAEVQRRCADAGLSQWTPLLADWLPGFLTTPLMLPGSRPVALAGLGAGRYRPEFEFHIEARRLSVPRLDAIVRAGTLANAPRPRLSPLSVNGLLKGFVDLVFEHDGLWWVADYKSNHRPALDPRYGQAALAHSILEHRYDLQYALYLLALHRFLRARLPDYDFDHHVGGAVYLYLRGVDDAGNGVFIERPPAAMIHALDALFAGSATTIPEADDALA